MRLPYIITDKTDSPLMAEGLSYIYNYYHWQKINVHTSTSYFTYNCSVHNYINSLNNLDILEMDGKGRRESLVLGFTFMSERNVPSAQFNPA